MVVSLVLFRSFFFSSSSLLCVLHFVSKSIGRLWVFLPSSASFCSFKYTECKSVIVCVSHFEQFTTASKSSRHASDVFCCLFFLSFVALLSSFSHSFIRSFVCFVRSYFVWFYLCIHFSFSQKVRLYSFDAALSELWIFARRIASTVEILHEITLKWSRMREIDVWSYIGSIKRFNVVVVVVAFLNFFGFFLKPARAMWRIRIPA